MPNDTPPLEFVDLIKDYEDLRAVDRVSFSIKPGEIFGLLGPNGAGKTTCISCITTLEAPTSGDIRVFGRSVLKDPTWCKKQFGLVPQELVSHGFFTISEILDFHGGYYGVTHNKKWIKELLQRLSLWQQRDKRVRLLSGGMKKRLAIAKALVHRPPLVLLDEPTAGIDIELRDILWDFVRELRDEGTTILLTTHYLQEAELLCDRVAMIDKGQIKRCGETKQMIRDLTVREVTITYRPEHIPEKIKSPYLKHQNHNKAIFQLPSHYDFRNLIDSAAIPPGSIQDVQIREGTLEDVMRQTVTFETEEER